MSDKHSVTVSVDGKPHGAGALHAGSWRAASKLATRLLSQAGHEGQWAILPVKRLRQKSAVRFRVTTFDKDQLLVVIKPAGNDSTWEYRVLPPESLRSSLFAVGKELSLWNGWDGKNIPEAVVANGGAPSEPEQDVEPPPKPKEPKPKEPEPEQASLLGMSDELSAAMGYAQRAEDRKRRRKILQEERRGLLELEEQLSAQFDELDAKLSANREATAALDEEEDADEGRDALQDLRRLKRLLSALPDDDGED